MARRNTIELSKQSFLETYGKIKPQEHQSEKLNRKIMHSAVKVIRSVSLKRKPSSFSRLRRTTISTTQDAKIPNDVEPEKNKLLMELSAQREKLLKEQQMLEELMKNPRKMSASHKDKATSSFSLYSSDLGYGSAIEEEDETMTEDDFKSSAGNLSSTADVSADIMAEIEDFENFIKSKC